MSSWKQQVVDDLRSAIADQLERRLAAARTGSAVDEQIRRLDAEIAEHCRSVADAERSLRMTP